MASTDYGRDLWCRTTLVTTREARGLDVLINALARRITTQKGTLYFHPDYGVDIPSIGDHIEPGTAQRIENEYKRACEADRRVRDGSVRVTVTETTNGTRTDLRAEITGTSAFGPFEFVTTIDRVTLALIGVQKGSA